MICPKHGAMLCYGNVLVNGKTVRIYRCVDGIIEKAERSLAKRKGAETPFDYKEVKRCEVMIDVVEDEKK